MARVSICIDHLKEVSNNEALSLYALSSTLSKNNISKALLSDFCRITNYIEQTIIAHFKTFTDLRFLEITKDKIGTYNGWQNVYLYHRDNLPTISVDSKILNLPVTKNQLGLLLRLKAYTLVGTNIIPFSINKIVRSMKANHDAVYAVLNAGIIKKHEYGFEFTDDTIFLID